MNPCTCRYEPDVIATRYDEDGNEVETDGPDEPAYDCDAFTCSECGGMMLFGEPDGWFDVEPPYRPHFSYCPYCGRSVEGARK